MKVSFDFDDTLHSHGRPLWPGAMLCRWHIDRGDEVLIVTTRTAAHEQEIWWRVHETERICVGRFMKGYKFRPRAVIYTSHRPKARFLVQHGIELHYDNDPDEVVRARELGVCSVLLQGTVL